MLAGESLLRDTLNINILTLTDFSEGKSHEGLTAAARKAILQEY
jgi:hypothetical protein